MDINQAYKITTASIEYIRSLGIRVIVLPCQSRNDPELYNRYSDHRLPPEQWNHVFFYPKNESETNIIHLKTQELAAIGIAFDNGGTAGERNWEIDWSFHIELAPNTERLEALDHIEEIITDEIETKKVPH